MLRDREGAVNAGLAVFFGPIEFATEAEFVTELVGRVQFLVWVVTAGKPVLAKKRFPLETVDRILGPDVERDICARNDLRRDQRQSWVSKIDVRLIRRPKYVVVVAETDVRGDVESHAGHISGEHGVSTQRVSRDRILDGLRAGERDGRAAGVCRDPGQPRIAGRRIDQLVERFSPGPASGGCHPQPGDSD